MPQITDSYRRLQIQLHKENPSYGTSGAKHADRILDLAQKLKTKDVLDFGCGRQTLQKSLPFPIQNYDPCIDGLDSPPRAADIVVCSDVLEHIEPECIDEVLQHLGELTKQVIFLDVATRPAQKVLADGRNAHILQLPVMKWLTMLEPYFELHSLQTYGGGFVMIATPWKK